MDHGATFTITTVRALFERVECDKCGRTVCEATNLLEGISAAATDSLCREHARRSHGADYGAEAIIDERDGAI